MKHSMGIGMVFAAALLAACGEGGDAGTGGGGAASSSATGGGGGGGSSSSSASGGSGGVPAPGWATELPADGGWTELAGSEPFEAWAAENLAPKTGYVGSGPIGAVRDAYCNPVFDHAGKAFYLFGGGHSDGSVNAVFKLDAATLKYSIVVPPTPPSAYPPAYTAPNSPIVYPSGATNGFFQTAATLTDAADLPYAAPFAAPQSSHTYSAMSFANGKVILHYGPVRDADVGSGTWSYLDKDTYGPQLVKFNPNYGEVVLQAGTRTANDPATGKAWTTLVPGDAGLNWRNCVLEMDPATHTVENVVSAKWEVLGDSSIVIGGPYVYVFTPTKSGGTATTTRGWRIDKATRAVEQLKLTGDLPSWPEFSPKQEGIPVFYDGSKLNFWNYGVDADRDAFFRVDLEPKSGAGTEEDPYVLSSTRETRPPSGMPSPALTYELTYIAEWGVVLFLPKASAKLWAIKL
ncbi:hypothetical protein [Polyangium mundeleinium]|uniref:Uncharacterized protein n=1 Tax=Polyangium mundeleinium TaxID=2995306 RepID=A0ABT5EVE1_9BACT|nr:hypothetical protein [Polyangium mundeleinium]MDC0745404.1 hypothetical protein [Polyangium mundeleinium]